MAVVLDERVGHAPGQSRSARAQHLVKALRQAGVPADVGQLEFGDVAFTGCGPEGPVEVGVELKSTSGLLTDLVSGRFVGHQVPGMQRLYPYRYLVVQGPFRPAARDGMLEVPRGGFHWWSPGPRMMYSAFIGFIEDITLRAGFSYHRTWDQTETVYLLAGIYKSWQKAWSAHKGLKQFNNAHQSGVVHLLPPTLTRLWARELPNVGWERSEAVERYFGTPYALATASQEEWEQIPGIGRTIARRVWRAIRGLK